MWIKGKLAVAVTALMIVAVHADDRIRPTCEETATTRRCWVEHGPSTGPHVVAVDRQQMTPPMPVPTLSPPNTWRMQVPPGLANYYCSVGVPRYC